MRDKHKDDEDRKKALRIMNQRRVAAGMEYALRCDGVLLTLQVSPRAGADETEGFNVEARSGRGGEPAVVVSEFGTTRLEALQAVGRAWASRIPQHGLAMFDWEAVARALLDVKAL